MMKKLEYNNLGQHYYILHFQIIATLRTEHNFVFTNNESDKRKGRIVVKIVENLTTLR